MVQAGKDVTTSRAKVFVTGSYKSALSWRSPCLRHSAIHPAQGPCHRRIVAFISMRAGTGRTVVQFGVAADRSMSSVVGRGWVARP